MAPCRRWLAARDARCDAGGGVGVVVGAGGGGGADVCDGGPQQVYGGRRAAARCGEFVLRAAADWPTEHQSRSADPGDYFGRSHDRRPSSATPKPDWVLDQPK